MTLASLLSPDRVIPEIEATEHWPSIVELVDHLIAGGYLRPESRDSVLEGFRKREDQRSTGIGGGIAIPHTFSPDVPEVTAIFGRSRKGIEFGALDNAPVRFVVLFIVPAKQYNQHLGTLAAIAKILNHGEVRKQLAEAASAEEILDVLEQKTARV